MSISSVTLRAVTTTNESTREFVQTTVSAPSPVAQKTAAADVAPQAPSPERVEQAVQQVNDAFSQKGQNLYAAIERDKETGINVVKVLDKNTEEVISQFPSKEIIAIAEAIDQSQEDKGQLLNVRA